MKFTKVFLVAVLVCFLFQLALGQKTKKRKLYPGTYKTTAKIFLKDEYRMYDSAIVILNEAVSFYPDDADLHFLLGLAYYHKNRAKEMGEHFALAESLEIKSKFLEEIQEMRQEKWLEVFNQGAKAFNEQNLDSALEKFTACTIINPRDYRGFMNAGYAHSLKGENAEAISYLEKGLELAPDTLDILRIYAAALYNAGNIEKALEVYLKVVDKDPKDVNTLNNIVSIYGILKDFENALQFSQKLIDVDSTFEDAYFNMGTIYLQQIQDVNFVLDSLKDTTGAYLVDEKCKAKIEELEKKRGGLLNKAESTLGKAVKLDSLDLEARMFLAKIYMEQEKLDEALGDLEFIVQNDSTNCEALTHLAGVYAKKGMGDEAKETWQKAQDCVEEK